MMGEWTFFSNYGHVLVCLARNGNARLRDVASEVGITERAVQKIVKDLQAEGFITVRKQGRCNRYRINRRKTLRHALESHCTVGKLLALVAAGRHEVSFASVEAAETAEVPTEPRPAAAPEPAPESRQAAPARVEPIGDLDSAPEAPQEAKPRPESKRKSKPKTAPLDVEQQGNLF